MTRRNWLLASALVLALAAGGFWMVERGLHTCGWLDLIIGRSGCLGTARFDGVTPGRGNPDIPFTAQGRAILPVDTRTADGWRNALLVFDPVSGEESGRYPVPLSNTNMQLLPAPDGKRLLLLCGITDGNCTEAGGDGVLVERDNLSAFTEAPEAGRDLRVFPGSPLPNAEYGYAARFAAGGERIVTDRRSEGVMMLDAEGGTIAVLSTQTIFASQIIVSPDGSRILRWQPHSGNGDTLLIWDAMNGRELGRIDGGPGWTLHGSPFWSADSGLIFAPRSAGGAMLLDRFEAP